MIECYTAFTLNTFPSWTKVRMPTYRSERRIEPWCKAQPSTGRFYCNFLDRTVYFEHEHDALLFTLWSSEQPKLSSYAWQSDIVFDIKQSIAGMSPGEFKVMYAGDWNNIRTL